MSALEERFTFSVLIFFYSLKERNKRRKKIATRPSESWEGQTFADQKPMLSSFAPLPLSLPSWQLLLGENRASALVRSICPHSLLFWQVVAIFPL